MSIITQIEADTIAAMKEKDQVRVDALRMVRAAIKNEQIALGHELSDAETVKVLQRQIKQRKDAAEQYRAGGRSESADKEEAEANLISSYLPTQMSDDVLKHLVEAVIKDLTAAGNADTGRVIGEVMKRAAGNADGGRVSQMVRAHLSQ